MKILIENVDVFIGPDKTNARQVELDTDKDRLTDGAFMASIDVVGENISFYPSLFEFGKVKKNWIDNGGKWL